MEFMRRHTETKECENGAKNNIMLRTLNTKNITIIIKSFKINLDKLLSVMVRTEFGVKTLSVSREFKCTQTVFRVDKNVWYARAECDRVGRCVRRRIVCGRLHPFTMVVDITNDYYTQNGKKTQTSIPLLYWEGAEWYADTLHRNIHALVFLFTRKMPAIISMENQLWNKRNVLTTQSG